MTDQSPEQIAKRVCERRMGSANCEDFETLAHAYLALRTRIAAAEQARDAAVELLREAVDVLSGDGRNRTWGSWLDRAKAALRGGGGG
ncbi:MAG: hypothetical protein WC718_16315 [Phycisphaerales bacterium]|jgi:hypothetical protein